MAKQSKPTRAEKDLTHVLIQTQAGQSIISKNSYVWVKAGEKTAAKKLVDDLKPGDQVLETNSRVSVTLNELKDALKEHNREYQIAHGLLHTQDPQTGEYKPRLQHYLQKALAARNLDLTDKEDKRKAIELIKERLQTVGDFTDNWFGKEKPTGFKEDPKRTDSAIEKWLSGETIAPSSPLALRALRKLNPKLFTEIFGEGSKITSSTVSYAESPVIWAHKTINKAHADLRVWREGRNVTRDDQDVDLTNHDDDDKTKTPKKGKDEVLLAQRKIIHDTLIKPLYDKIDTQHGFVLVKNVREIPTATARTTKTTGLPITPSLPRGVMHADKTPLPKGIETTDYARLTGEYWALKVTLAKILAKNDIPAPRGADKGGVALGILDYTNFRKLGLKVRVFGAEFATPEVFFNNIMGKVEDGTFDAQHDLAKGTTKQLIDRYFHVQQINPVRHAVETVYSNYKQLYDQAAGRVPVDPRLPQTLADAVKKINKYAVPIFPYQLTAMRVAPAQLDKLASDMKKLIEDTINQEVKGKPTKITAPIMINYKPTDLEQDLKKHSGIDHTQIENIRTIYEKELTTKK